MVNFSLVIERIEKLKGISGDKNIAALLGISPQDFSNRKKRGSLLPVIFEWAIHENVNLEWLIKGNESQTIAAETHENYGKAVNPRTAAMAANFEALEEEDKRALERIALTLAQSQKRMKKAG